MAPIQNEGPHNIYLSSIQTYTDIVGVHVTGNLAIVNFAGDNISVPFTGMFYDNSGLQPNVLDISGTDGGVDFRLYLEILSNGNLYCSHDQSIIYNFHVLDTNNGFDDDAAPRTSQYYITMAPNPNGLP